MTAELADLATEDRPRLPGRRMRIYAEGQVHEVRILNKDRVQWDKTSRAKKWGPAQDSPFLASSFLAFLAAVRAGVFTGIFDAFVEWADEVEDVTDQEDELGADPTKKGQQATSA